MQEPRVLVVDDDPLVTHSITTILAARGGYEVVASAADGDEAVQATQAHFPDVVLMDIHMHRVDGIRATRAIRQLPQPPYVIMLTNFDQDRYVFDAVEAGADGYLLKVTAADELTRAIDAVIAGDAFLSPPAARKLVDGIAARGGGAGRQAAAEALDALSERERQVLVLVGAGLTNDQIGQQLYLSPSTVKQHISAMGGRLGANRIQLAVLAERAGLLPH